MANTFTNINITKVQSEITEALSDKHPVTTCETMEDAVEQAYKNSKKGQIVLLSPGCASFDMYNNYEERGDHFRHIVLSLIQRETL